MKNLPAIIDDHDGLVVYGDVRKVAINHPETPTTGTSLRGYYKGTYGLLEATMGPPMKGDDKTQYEWHLWFDDGIVVTVYDYKHRPVQHPREITSWHIGGHFEHRDRLFEYLRNIFGDDSLFQESPWG